MNYNEWIMQDVIWALGLNESEIAQLEDILEGSDEE